ncbi:hypothetical protein GIB67_015324 [Kingdonia uniflora]|uniref:Uncharacterized protein n=1 Tax=Kingdonia uniflora TaxID=39325 RepID=A0A7J7KYM7_9MAGN|nr:hypothetical protein GIB67_015324 [Kingdonia uniflora]
MNQNTILRSKQAVSGVIIVILAMLKWEFFLYQEKVYKSRVVEPIRLFLSCLIFA